jgi:hypothetical protein
MCQSKKQDVTKMIKRFTTRTGLCFIVAAYLVIALGCSSPTSQLIGKCSDEKNQETFEFLKDDTYMFQKMGMTLSGKRTLDVGRIKIHFEGFGPGLAITHIERCRICSRDLPRRE